MRTTFPVNTTIVRLAASLAAAAVLLAIVCSLPPVRRAGAQEETPAAAAAGQPSSGTPEQAGKQTLNVFELAVAGGIFMLPIVAMSLLAATIAFERALALRRSRVVPRGLAVGLGEMSSWAGGGDPQRALRLCQQFPSAAATVIRATLARVGRPVAELEAAAAAASQREADKLYANVRWLTLAASISTMLGLIGTIQGMILAFHRLTVLDAAADRTTMLAAGIYTALVTTFAGLTVAIPALFIAHYFETRILRMFHEIDELVQTVLPSLPRLEAHSPPRGTGPNGDQRQPTVSPTAPHAS